MILQLKKLYSFLLKKVSWSFLKSNQLTLIKAHPWQVTDASWATGFDIKIDGISEFWEIHIDGLRKNNNYIFTAEDRRKMHEIRDYLVKKIND